jgi:hypothetical protein
LSIYCPIYTSVDHELVLDAKPSDMATVFTTMKGYSEMSNAVGQENHIQSFD